MSDIFERQRKIGNRVSEERKLKGWSQEKLAEELSIMLDCRKPIAQTTVLNWEKGNSNIPLDRLIALSKLFKCDCGYLLCDYDQKTHDAVEIHSITGLSDQSINYLSFCKTWGFDEIATVIDVLIRDCQIRNSDGRRRYKSIVESLYSFLVYSGKGKRYLATRNGHLCEDKTNDGTVSVGATSIDDTMIENAILVEIQNALISLKRGMDRG